MTERVSRDYRTFLLTFIIGLSMNGTFNALFDSVISFPIIALCFSVYCVYQRYVTYPIPEGTPALAVSCFLLGTFLYSSVIRAEYTGIGSNFLLTIICVSLVFRIGYKLNISQPRSVK